MRGLRILTTACLCGAILLGATTGRAQAGSAEDDAALAALADKTMQDIKSDELKAKKAKFESLFSKAKDLFKSGQYDQALVSVEEALSLYPADEGAKYLKSSILFDSNKSREELLKSARVDNADTAMADIEKGRIIQQETISISPESWADVLRRTQKADDQGVEGKIVSEWKSKLEEKLSDRISFEFKDASLAEVTDYLQDLTNVGIVIDPKAPVAVTPITLKAQDVTLESALNHICRFSNVKWSMADTMIYISGEEVGETMLATYPVEDLLTAPRDFRADDRPSPVGAIVDSTRNKGFGVEVSYPDDTAIRQDKSGEELAQFIMNTVAPDSWSKPEEGGVGANTIQYRNGRLVVSHNEKVQEQILKLLESFRKARTVQVMVQSRFIEIEKNYLEQIGVDWTGLEGGVNTISTSAQHTPIDNDGNLVPIQRGFSARGKDMLDEFGNAYSTGYAAGPGIPDGGRAPEPTTYWIDANGDGVADADEIHNAEKPAVGHLDIGMANINQLGLTLGNGTDFTPDGGLMLDLAYLSKYQVRALLDMVVKHRKGNVLTSPRLTCFNGERANIAVTSQVNYLRNVTEGTPEIGTITDGIVFEVVPYASADRRYVTMEILPTLRTLQRPIQQVTISLPEILADGELSVTNTIIQLPQVTVKSVETFASVPDGGTLMLGGLSRANEGEGSSGIPIINDIPVVKYLFSRWGKTDTRSSLIILIKADILIQGEEEPNVGPTS